MHDGEIQPRMHVYRRANGRPIFNRLHIVYTFVVRTAFPIRFGSMNLLVVQEKRVQKYVETLDVIRAKNASAPTANGHAKNAAASKANGHGNGPAKADRSLHLPPRPPPVSQRRQFKQQPAPATGKAAAAPPTASWETFDLLSSMPSTSSATATTTMAAATTTTKPASNNNNASPIPRFDWELF